jgi:predicted RNA-binding Zn ribbon-like protein
MLVPVVRSAVELLTSDAASRIGRCADEGCAWLFLDTTRSGTRRWCDMKSCGNRNTVRRFRAT